MPKKNWTYEKINSQNERVFQKRAREIKIRSRIILLKLNLWMFFEDI